ncbi:hypothetical protein [Agarivorans sp.]|uniref:hypothetical protein n=1 Tax=Agarivorans sp. TaxID=1872412 RepID=UPI003D0957CC
MNKLTIDWFKLEAQFNHPQLLRRWLEDFLAGSEQEQALLQQALFKKRSSPALELQLQGVAALLCSPALHYCLQQLKQSEHAQQPLQQCWQVYQELLIEVAQKLEQPI